MEDLWFDALREFIGRTPGASWLSGGPAEGGGWWAKFDIDIAHPLAWQVVQEFGHVLNLLSVEARLPSRFLPVSPPPYLNGGPAEFLSWVIECPDSSFTPADAAKWLEGRLPKPVENLSEWVIED